MKLIISETKELRSRGLLMLLAASLCLSVAAEERKNDPGLLNGWLREKSPACDASDFGGQGRICYEVKENAGSFPNNDFIRKGVDNDNSYLLLREKIHLSGRYIEQSLNKVPANGGAVDADWLYLQTTVTF